MERKPIQILEVLDRAACACPVGYISLHTNIVDPLKILDELEEEVYCRRSPPSKWAPTGDPKFEITPKARQMLKEQEKEVRQIPLNQVARVMSGIKPLSIQFILKNVKQPWKVYYRR